MTRGSFGFVVVSWLLVALPAGAGDGVREINQSCAAVGCWPGDSPGLPVEIVETGSYRLTGGLLVDANTDAIVVNADNVSIDLNGFTIRGPAQVTIEPDGSLLCSSPGPGHAIFALFVPRTEVRNGFVAGIPGLTAVALGDGARVERLSVEASCGTGISAGFSSSVVESRSRLALGAAIQVGNASRISGVIADFSGSGISTGTASVVSDSVATSNLGTGVRLEYGSVLSNSTVSFNGWHFGSPAILAVGGPSLLMNTFVGSNGDVGYEDPSGLSGFGGIVFNGNVGGGSVNGSNLICNLVDGVSFCPTHP